MKNTLLLADEMTEEWIHVPIWSCVCLVITNPAKHKFRQT